jgi:glucosamine-phosphate N-acetyltransferase
MTAAHEQIRQAEEAVLRQASDSEFQIRRLAWDDFGKGFLEVLAGLTKVGDTDKAGFEKRFFEIFPRLSDTYKIIVIEDVKRGKIVGAGSLIVELKFIRDTGICGHIEDIVVDSSLRGKNLGKRIIETLKQLAVANKCYKVILDCAEKNVKFYEKCGFKVKEVEMAWYVEAPGAPKL